MGVDHGGQVVYLCHIDTKGAFCGLQNMPKSVFGRALSRTPPEELTTLPQTPSQLERGHPSPYPTQFGTDPSSALAMRPPQNSSQIYAYVWNLWGRSSPPIMHLHQQLLGPLCSQSRDPFEHHSQPIDQWRAAVILWEMSAGDNFSRGNVRWGMYGELVYNSLLLLIFSERELKFMFAICHRPSVCRLSSVTFVRPTQTI